MTPSDRSPWQGRWIIAFSLLALASSGFGQTFFIAVFGAELRTAFALSHTAYGTLYSLATLGAAGLLWRAGVWTDVWPPRRVVTVAVGILALGCILIGLAPHAALLGLGFLLIRFGGQGLLTHLAMTTAGRAFSAHRGKAIALTATGAPLAEACLPALAVALLGAEQPGVAPADDAEQCDGEGR
ncbi:MAG: MFS transporter, partial [Candidatus Competibacteraceae bacterium]